MIFLVRNFSLGLNSEAVFFSLSLFLEFCSFFFFSDKSVLASTETESLLPFSSVLIPR